MSAGRSGAVCSTQTLAVNESARALAPAHLLLAILPSIALGLLNGFYFPMLTRASPVLYWTADVAQFVIVPAVMFGWLAARCGVRPGQLGFSSLVREGSALRAAGIVLLVSVLYLLFHELVQALARALVAGSEASVPFVDVLPQSQPWRWLAVLYASASAALVEEVVFRSVPWLVFAAWLRAPQVPYVLSTSILFAAIHWEQGAPGVLAAGAVGLVSASLYPRIRNVWPFVIAHFIAGVWSYPWL